VEKLQEKSIKFQLTDGAKKYLAEQGFDPLYGARPLKRAIQKNLEDPIADELLMGHFKEGSTIQVKLKGKSELVFTELGKEPVSDKETESDIHSNN